MTTLPAHPVGFDQVLGALLCAEPEEKIARVRRLSMDWTGSIDPARSTTLVSAPIPIPVPGRPERPQLVAPRLLKSRGLGSAGGRAALIHAVAHIEFNAINLALDAAYRFRGMPEDFYRDWIDVALDEARHFELLCARLGEHGSAYGDLPAHNGLWEAACKTADSCLRRMALVPRVLEARGLDVTPAMIERLRKVGDLETVAVLELILREEVAHVAVGTRWFVHCCAEQGLDPELTFLDLVRTYSAPAIRPPFNDEARRRAGFTEAERAGLAAIAGLTGSERAAEMEGGPMAGARSD